MAERGMAPGSPCLDRRKVTTMLLHTTRIDRNDAIDTSRSLAGSPEHAQNRSCTSTATTPDTHRMESMDSSGNERDMMSVAETAKALSRSTEQVRRYLREGRLPGRRMGGQWFIERSAVESFGKAASKEDRFTRKLRPASRIRPLDDVIGIGEGPGSNISGGKEQYRIACLRRR